MGEFDDEIADWNARAKKLRAAHGIPEDADMSGFAIVSNDFLRAIECSLKNMTDMRTQGLATGRISRLPQPWWRASKHGRHQ